MNQDKLRQALERAQEDINWMLNSRQFLNGHVFDYIDEALTASKPEAQAQAGEPEVVAWAIPRSDGLVLDVICPDEHEAYEGDYTIPLITLQSHRDAMAVQAWSKDQAFCLAMLKKDAALKSCVGALEIAIYWMDSSGVAKDTVDAAIEQAKGAMK